MSKICLLITVNNAMVFKSNCKLFNYSVSINKIKYENYQIIEFDFMLNID